jgi:hypothetical protein
MRKRENIMTNDFKLLHLQNRYERLSASAKNFKCPGVLRKLRRQIRGLESKLSF